MATLYRDMLVTEFLGWAKQHDLPARLDALLANVATPDLVKSLCRVGKAFCEETQIKTFDADKVLSLANNASLAGIITSDEKTSLLAIIAFDPDEEKLKEVADHVVARQDEVAAYQVNIDNYTAMLTILDGELPEGTVLEPGVQGFVVGLGPASLGDHGHAALCGRPVPGR